MRKVLVAGSTGYLGKFVVRELKERGYWVRALARNHEKLKEIGPFLEPAVIDMVDEVYTGEVTKPETLLKICNKIDIVFSSIGITRQKDKLSYRDVDYQGNKVILDIALAKSVKKFVYVSVFNAHLYEHLEIIKAHEDFVRDLQSSGIRYSVIRPTGYFSDMTEFLKMANSGRVYLVGSGKNRINPIHGADLAKVCVDAVEGKETEVPVGGPVIYSVQDIAELAFLILGKKPKITHIPTGLATSAISMIRPFNKQMSDLVDFFITAGKGEGVAPTTGSYTLPRYYREIAAQWLKHK